MVNFKEVEQGIFKEIENKGLKVDEWDLKKIFHAGFYTVKTDAFD